MRERLRPLLAHPLFTPLVGTFGARRAARRLGGTSAEIGLYHSRRARHPSERWVSDSVWSDLDMDAVFARIDRCASTVGQQVLHDLLRRPAPERAMERDAVARRLAEAPELGRAIERAMSGLQQRGAYDLPHLILDDLPPKPRFAFVFPLLTLVAIASIVTAFFRPVALFGLLAVACVNVGIQAYYRPRVYHLITPIAAMRALLLAARRLGRLNDPALEPYTARLRESGQRLRAIDRYARHLLRETLGNEFLETVAGYGNLLFLLDVNAFVFSIERIRRHREALRDLFETVGFLDAMRAVAHFRSTLPHWCAPEFAATSRKELTAAGLYHPLLDEPVANDLDVRGRSILITGSNMAGKTTFLRAAGTCAILAETIATCPARRWHAPPLRVATHIDRGDDIIEGKSYFLVEAEAVLELLTRADGEEQHLFIVDEIFRGTNTRERIAAAKAVLDRLDRDDHICLVSTHDLELLDLLGERWEFHHFRETVHDGAVRFDFLIRPGASSAPNAIRLLAATGYPDDVVEEAMKIYDRAEVEKSVSAEA